MDKIHHGMIRVPLTQGKFAVVDKADAKAVKAHKWYAIKCGTKWYARRIVGHGKTGSKYQYLHHFIRGTNAMTDHRDRDGLNNRRSNLRACNKTLNGANTEKRRTNKSGFKGVSWSKCFNRWIAQINGGNRTTIHLGGFQDPIDAAKAYDSAARSRFGEFAVLNFP